MQVVCLDLEGVLVPEIWIGVAERTGIEDLRLTTRDIADYDELMGRRLAHIDEHALELDDIRQVIEELEPLPGAVEFLGWLRERFQVVILSDTFYQFAMPLMRKLAWPVLFCHELVIDEAGKLVGYKLRQHRLKHGSVQAFKSLNFRVLAAGDSYNDIDMLKAADAGVLFRPPENVIREFPELPVTRTYEELKAAFLEASRI